MCGERPRPLPPLSRSRGAHRPPTPLTKKAHPHTRLEKKTHSFSLCEVAGGERGLERNVCVTLLCTLLSERAAAAQTKKTTAAALRARASFARAHGAQSKQYRRRHACVCLCVDVLCALFFKRERGKTYAARCEGGARAIQLKDSTPRRDTRGERRKRNNNEVEGGKRVKGQVCNCSMFNGAISSSPTASIIVIKGGKGGRALRQAPREAGSEKHSFAGQRAGSIF